MFLRLALVGLVGVSLASLSTSSGSSSSSSLVSSVSASHNSNPRFNAIVERLEEIELKLDSILHSNGVNAEVEAELEAEVEDPSLFSEYEDYQEQSSGVIEDLCNWVKKTVADAKKKKAVEEAYKKLDGGKAPGPVSMDEVIKWIKSNHKDEQLANVLNLGNSMIDAQKVAMLRRENVAKLKACAGK